MRGLHIEGCSWDAAAGALAESAPNELFQELPVMWLQPERHRAAPTRGVYVCPVGRV